MNTAPRITLLASQLAELENYLAADPDGHERAAIILFRRFSDAVWGSEGSERFVAAEVHPFAQEWVTSSSSSHIAFETRPLREFFRRCKDESLVFGFVHNHPTGFSAFSDVDEENERTLLTALTNRNGKDLTFLALLWTGVDWKARVRSAASPENSFAARHILVTARPFKLFRSVEVAPQGSDQFLARQAAAFGEPFVQDLASLRVGVIGAGGTGSPTITLLARAGVGEIVVVDPDALEKSNLNRVRGARASDIGINKAKVIADFVTSMALRTRVAAIPALADSNAEAVDALASCDVIFGCTDDQIGRELLNTCAYAYAQAYIDVGLGGRVDTDEKGNPYLRYHHGRVSTILPEDGECLFCQSVISEGQIRRGYALRENPDLTDEEARERYLEGGAEQAPGVGPFTSAIADYGVATLFDLIRGFRKFPAEVRWDSFTVDFVRMRIRSSEAKNNSECPYCGLREYLVLKEKYRLNRPNLGKRDAVA